PRLLLAVVLGVGVGVELGESLPEPEPYPGPVAAAFAASADTSSSPTVRSSTVVAPVRGSAVARSAVSFTCTRTGAAEACTSEPVICELTVPMDSRSTADVLRGRPVHSDAGTGRSISSPGLDRRCRAPSDVVTSSTGAAYRTEEVALSPVAMAFSD